MKWLQYKLSLCLKMFVIVHTIQMLDISFQNASLERNGPATPFNNTRPARLIAAGYHCCRHLHPTSNEKRMTYTFAQRPQRESPPIKGSCDNRSKSNAIARYIMDSILTGLETSHVCSLKRVREPSQTGFVTLNAILTLIPAPPITNFFNAQALTSTIVRSWL